MRYRILIFEDNDSIRSTLWQFFDSLGYEVFTFPDPSLCPLNEKPTCDCPLQHACSDMIISDINMPVVKGLDFIKSMRRKGCKVTNIAIMSGNWNAEAAEESEKLGFEIIDKPFKLDVLQDWLKKCEQSIQENRKLLNWLMAEKNKTI